MAGWTVRRGVVLGLGAVWWWAVVRLAMGDGDVVEGAVATGGWGLSLLPVHCVPKGKAAGGAGAGRWVASERVAVWRMAAWRVAAWRVGRLTRASRPRRSDAGSGPS